MMMRGKPVRWVWAAVDKPIWPATRESYFFGDRRDVISLVLPRNLVRQFEYAAGGDSPHVRPGETVVSVLVPRWLAYARGMRVLSDG